MDYGYSAGSYVLPLVLGPLGVEAITQHAFESDASSGPVRLHETIQQARRLVEPVNADFGVAFDRSAERLYLIDERGREVTPGADPAPVPPPDRLERASRQGRRPDERDQPGRAARDGRDRGRPHSGRPAPADPRGHPQEGFTSAGRGRRRYVFPDFLPAYDSIALSASSSSCWTLYHQPLSAAGRRPCPSRPSSTASFSARGRSRARDARLNECYADGNVDLRDGIEIFDERGLGPGAARPRRAGDPRPRGVQTPRRLDELEEGAGGRRAASDEGRARRPLLERLNQLDPEPEVDGSRPLL